MKKMMTLIALLFVAATLSAETGYKVQTRYPVPGDGGFDYVTVDSAARRVYLSHGTQVDVVDAVNGEDTGEVIAFDPKSLEVKQRFPIGVAKTPTGLAYDAKTNRLFIGTRNEPKMIVMDAANGKVINSYPIGAGVDFAAFDPKAK